MRTLTKKQRQIFDYIEEFMKSAGFAPSYREIAEHFGLSSVATVHDHIKSLEDKGYISISEGSARSIEILDGHFMFRDHTLELPLAGLIAAGEPIEAIEGNEKITVPPDLVRGEKCFALQVKGDSMIEDGIFDGDYVICEKHEVANNGDTIVALLENRYATLKKFYKEKDHVRLEPANSSMEPIIVREDLKIQGRVVGLIRKY
ncbi:MAG: hypothetical protein ACD_63C00125G0003 [uncultured bacterium]|nr:MAG: hypothetical protein ACD_63C00125G0003 [uncultured bacterium]